MASVAFGQGQVGLEEAVFKIVRRGKGRVNQGEEGLGLGDVSSQEIPLGGIEEIDRSLGLLGAEGEGFESPRGTGGLSRFGPVAGPGFK